MCKIGYVKRILLILLIGLVLGCTSEVAPVSEVDIDATVERLMVRGVIFDTEEVQAIDVDVVSTKESVRYIFFDMPMGVKGELYEVKPTVTQ